MEGEYFEFNTKKAKDFFSSKKVQNIFLIVLLISTIFVGSLIRVQNMDLLQDQTTGEKIPLALDPFYFLRLAETIVDQGSLPAVDNMRYPSASVGFTAGITHWAIVSIYKVSNIFGEFSIQSSALIYPIMFFILGLIVFFLLAWHLTKSKSIALISSIFLSFIPSYIYRTLAGFADHEAIGMFAFLLALLGLSFCMNYFYKEKIRKNQYLKSALIGLGLGILTSFTMASWSGIVNILVMIFAFSFGLFWIIKTKSIEKSKNIFLQNFILFYLIWIVSSVLTSLIYGFSLNAGLSKILLSSSSLLNSFVFLFVLADFSLIKFKDKIGFLRKSKYQKYRIFWSVLIVFILGAIFLSFYKEGLFSYIGEVFSRLLQPFGSSRTGSTVAENAQPFLRDWQAQTGKIFFWIFLGGLIAIGGNFAKSIKSKKYGWVFFITWALMILGILFSKTSPDSLLNGNNFISKLVYFGALILFFSVFIWIYLKTEIKFKPEQIVMFSWLLFMLVSVRGAVRFFFLLTPFACFSAGFFIFEVTKYAKSSKDDLIKMFFILVSILAIIGAIISVLGIPGSPQYPGFIKSSFVQAENNGPSADVQWQEALNWVKENTSEGSIFVHWWDYGYWVQYLGERPSVTDGGHAIGFWDHLIGRYLLTTPHSETALSFMKAHNVSYLLIDKTDLGKYGAYSKIGSGPEGTSKQGDRFSNVIYMFPDNSQETRNKNTTLIVYQGLGNVDEDIVYDSGGKEIFLPKNKALIGGILLEIENNEIQQPRAVFFYNENQVYIPLRYAYFEGELRDFGGGLEAVAYLIPRLVPSGNNLEVDPIGSMIYLSPKVSSSLFAQLYLMDDALDNYPTLRLVHSEKDPLLKILENQGFNLNRDIIYYNGIRGPIKIWEVDYPGDIIAREEFLQTEGEYAEFDDLQFKK